MLDDPTFDDPSRDLPPADDDRPQPQLPTEIQAARARDGDPISWQTLESKVRKMLKEAFAPGWRLRQYSVDDLIQTTLFEIHRDFAKFKPEAGSNFRGWVRQIAKHNHLDMCRKEGREDKNAGGLLHMDQTHAGGSGNMRDRLPDPDEHRPSMHARMNELVAAFRTVLDSLRPEARLIIELRDFEGLNFDEIMHRVGRNKVDTVKAIYYRAKAKLTGDLEGHA